MNVTTQSFGHKVLSVLMALVLVIGLAPMVPAEKAWAAAMTDSTVSFSLDDGAHWDEAVSGGTTKTDVEYTYNGQQQIPELRAQYNDPASGLTELQVLYAGEDADATQVPDAWYYVADTSASDGTNAGTVTLHVDASDSIELNGKIFTTTVAHSAKQGVSYVINPAEIAPTFTIADQAFGANTQSAIDSIKYTAEGMFGDDQLAYGIDYEVEFYRGGVEYDDASFAAGDYTAVITAQAGSNYTFGEQRVDFTVDQPGTEKADISKAEVVLEADSTPSVQGDNAYVYDGAEVKPAVASIVDEQGQAIPESGYEVSYRVSGTAADRETGDLTNYSDGTADLEVVITGVGSYYGEQVIGYSIQQAELTLTANDVSKEYDGRDYEAPKASAETVAVSGLAEGDSIDWSTVSLTVTGNSKNVGDEGVLTPAENGDFKVNSDVVDEDATEAAPGGETVYVEATGNYKTPKFVAGSVERTPFTIEASDLANLNWTSKGGVQFGYGEEIVGSDIVGPAVGDETVVEWSGSLIADVRANNLYEVVEVVEDELPNEVGLHTFTLQVKAGVKNFVMEEPVQGTYSVAAKQVTVSFVTSGENAYKTSMVYGDADWKAGKWDPTTYKVSDILTVEGERGVTVSSATFTNYGEGDATTGREVRVSDVKLVDAEGHDVTADYEIVTEAATLKIDQIANESMPKPVFKNEDFHVGDTVADALTEESLKDFTDLGIDPEDLLWYSTDRTLVNGSHWSADAVLEQAGEFNDVYVGVKSGGNFAGTDVTRSNEYAEKLTVKGVELELDLPNTATKEYDQNGVFDVTDQVRYDSSLLKEGDQLKVIVVADDGADVMPATFGVKYDAFITDDASVEAATAEGVHVLVLRPVEDDPETMEAVTDEYSFEYVRGEATEGRYTIAKGDFSAHAEITGIPENIAVAANGSKLWSEIDASVSYQPDTVKEPIVWTDDQLESAGFDLVLEQRTQEGAWREVSVDANTALEIGEYRYTIKATTSQSITGSVQFEFSVRSDEYDLSADASGIEFSVRGGETAVTAIYDGKAHNLGTVTATDAEDRTFTDFELVYKNDEGDEVSASDVVDVDTYTVVARGTGLYFGEKTVGTVTISKAPFNADNFDVSIANVVYKNDLYDKDNPADVEALAPKATSKIDGTSVDVTIASLTGLNNSARTNVVYEDGEILDAYQAQIYFAGNDNYESGTVEGVKGKILPFDLSTAVVELDDSSWSFTGVAAEPALASVKSSAEDDAAAFNTTDFTPVTVKNDQGADVSANLKVYAGDYTAQWKVLNENNHNYTGTLSAGFSIDPISLVASAVNDAWIFKALSGFAYSPTGTPVCYQVKGDDGAVVINGTDVTKFLMATATDFGTGEVGQSVTGTLKAQPEYAGSILGEIAGVEMGEVAKRVFNDHGSDEGVKVTVARQAQGTGASMVPAEDVTVIIDGMTIAADQYKIVPTITNDKLTVTMLDEERYDNECPDGDGHVGYTVDVPFVDPSRDLSRATVTAAPESAVYDGRAQDFQVTVVNSLGQTVPADEYDVWFEDAEGRQFDQPVDAGVYTVVVSAKADSDLHYVGTNAEETVEVAKAQAHVDADDASKAYGEADPAFTASVSGVAEGDALSYALEREPGESVGEYAIRVVLGENPNYDVETAEGTLTIGPAASAGFEDVPAGSWYEQWVDMAYAAGLMGAGTGSLFDPEGELTRAQVATILYRATVDDSSDTTDPAKYADNETGLAGNPDGMWYTAAVNWAYEAGVMTGNEGDLFAEDAVTRAQLGTMVERWAASQGVDTASADQSALRACSDVETVPEWAFASLAWTADAGVLGGYANADGTFTMAPEDGATRAQMAKVIVTALAAVRG